MLEVRYHPELVQEVVFMELRKQEGTELYEEYYRLADEIYQSEETNRGARFKRLDGDFFHRLGLHKTFSEELKDLITINGKLKTIQVLKARTKEEAGSDLARDGQEAFLKLFPEDFGENGHLRRMLRHELMHLRDMLDEGFGYKDGRLENVVRERYKLLWDISIDSRLERLNKETKRTKEERFQEFQALFRSIVPGKEREIFEGLWGETSLNHDRIRGLASEPRLVAGYAGLSKGEWKGPSAGSPCPLCKCPTHNWVKGPEIRQEVIGLVKEESSPGWEPIQGICETCYQYYLDRAGLLWL